MSDLSRVEELAQRVADGMADEAVMAELEALMKGDPEARRLYLLTLQLHHDLERKSARGTLSQDRPEEEFLIDFPNPSESHSTPEPEAVVSKHNPWRKIAGLAAAAAIAVLAWPFIQDQLFNDAPMAMITRLDKVDASLAYHQPFEEGDRITFNKGVLEITYKKGTRVILQGPADYTLENADNGRLEMGSLAAEVPPAASGFTVVTPSAEVKDIGTKFAVAQLDTGRTEFKVLEGEVEAKSSMAKSEAKSFKNGDIAAIDDGETEVQSIAKPQTPFNGIFRALNRHTVEAVADCFVQGGEHAGEVPGDSREDRHKMLLLKQLGQNDRVARKVWIRFDLSDQNVDPYRPATLTLHTAKDITPMSWDIQLHGLLTGFNPDKGSQGIDWRENSLTWNSAPGNEIDSGVGMNRKTGLITTNKIKVDRESEPAGSFFTFTIPALKPYIQEDGTVTLMLSTVTGRHQVLGLASREHKEFAGPLLTFETRNRILN